MQSDVAAPLSLGKLELQVEALLFAASGPIKMPMLAQHCRTDDIEQAIARLTEFWSTRGMRVQVKGDDIAFVPAAASLRALAEAEGKKARRLSDAAVETLCYVAMHQPVTLADIETGRGVKLFKGLMDSLLDAGFVRASVRRTDSGRASVYVTTDLFLEHFGLNALSDLPTLEELPDLINPPKD